MRKINQEIIQLLACPDCRSNLSLTKNGQSFECKKCFREFNILKDNFFTLLPKNMSVKKKEIMNWWGDNKPDLDAYIVGSENIEEGSWLYYKNTDRKWFKWHHPWAATNLPLFQKWIDYSSLLDKKVLEIGSGVGTMFENFCGLGIECHALELNYPCAYLTHRRTELNNFKGKGYVYQADAENLPFKDNSFDYILSYGVLHHSENTQQAFDEIYRVLKPKGKFFIMVYNKDSINYWWHIFFGWGILKGKLWKMTPRQLMALRTDRNYQGGNPRADFLSKKELKRMLAKFSKLELSPSGPLEQIKLLPWSKLPLAKFITPNFIAQKLVDKYGKLIFVRGEKK